MNVGIGVGIVALAYLSNMCLGVWYNVNIIGENFNWRKLGWSLLKIVAIAVGVVLLTTSITLIVPFAQKNGLPIPEEYQEVVQVIAVLAVCLSAALQYIKDAWTKFNDILHSFYVQPIPETDEAITENIEVEDDLR